MQIRLIPVQFLNLQYEFLDHYSATMANNAEAFAIEHPNNLADNLGIGIADGQEPGQLTVPVLNPFQAALLLLRQYSIGLPKRSSLHHSKLII